MYNNLAIVDGLGEETEQLLNPQSPVITSNPDQFLHTCDFGL